MFEYSTVDIPASSTANNVILTRSTRIMFPIIAFPSHESLSGSAAVRETAGGAVFGLLSRQARKPWLATAKSGIPAPLKSAAIALDGPLCPEAARR